MKKVKPSTVTVPKPTPQEIQTEIFETYKKQDLHILSRNYAELRLLYENEKIEYGNLKMRCDQTAQEREAVVRNILLTLTNEFIVPQEMVERFKVLDYTFQNDNLILSSRAALNIVSEKDLQRLVRTIEGYLYFHFLMMAKLGMIEQTTGDEGDEFREFLQCHAEFLFSGANTERSSPF